MKNFLNNAIIRTRLALSCSRKGMELVQVAILIAIAIAIGLIFKKQITDFVNDVFGGLKASEFK